MERSTSPLAYNGDNEKGGTIVESAVTLPVLFLILFGILMFGRAFNVYQTITDAAREGARYAGQPCSAAGNALDCSGQTATCTYGTLPSTTQVQACVQKYLDASHIRGSTIAVTTPTYTVNGSDLVYTGVQVTVPFEMRYLPFTFNITTQSEMRSETN